MLSKKEFDNALRNFIQNYQITENKIYTAFFNSLIFYKKRRHLYNQRIKKLRKKQAKYQKQFLRAASKTVKKGGSIVYSVCTVTLEECEEVVQFAVDNCDLEVTEQKMYIGSRGIPLENIPYRNLQRFHPHKHGAGFFIACFKKD